ncbi:ABC transporter ATP-binding protein [Paenibacillus sp. M1]|uniref:ABC transporter ATP-binding protein n=1 Tax=Paenibacillus haidiansis TaxID=1574488 RepID=A0ABU7VXS6_9BACL
MANAIVKFENVSKQYPRRCALQDVSFELPQGKIIGLIGANGSGKSTTLKLMAGLIRPSRGAVVINGVQMNRRHPEQVSFLPDHNYLYPFYTVMQTIEFFHGVYSDFDRDKAADMLAFMELSGDQPIKALSKGNMARLKIILALSRQVPLILMDEPLSGLDPIVRGSIIKSLISFVDIEHQTVVLSTHEVAEIEPLLDMAVLIHNGRIQSIQEVDEIRASGNMNLVEWMRQTK